MATYWFVASKAGAIEQVSCFAYVVTSRRIEVCIHFQHLPVVDRLWLSADSVQLIFGH